MDKPEQEYLTLKAIVEPASQTVLRVNQEPQSPILPLTEFLINKRHEGWTVMGIAPSGSLLLLILKRPLASPLQPEAPKETTVSHHTARDHHKRVCCRTHTGHHKEAVRRTDQPDTPWPRSPHHQQGGCSHNVPPQTGSGDDDGTSPRRQAGR